MWLTYMLWYVARPSSIGFPSPRLPPEVLDLIIDHIRDDDVDDLDFYSNSDAFRSLCACCLVCHHLSLRSRRNLLRRVCITKMRQLELFTWMLGNVAENRQFVYELIVFSTSSKPSPAEVFPVLLAHKLPKLRCLRLRTEMGPVPDPGMRPVFTMHRNAIAALSSFQHIAQLQLFGLRFGQYKQFLRLISSLPELLELQCMQIWFNPSGTRSTSDLFIPESSPKRQLKLSSVDV